MLTDIRNKFMVIKDENEGWGSLGLIDNTLHTKLEKELAPHTSTLAWKIPWTEEAGGLQSMGSQSRTRLSTYHRHIQNR